MAMTSPGNQLNYIRAVAHAVPLLEDAQLHWRSRVRDARPGSVPGGTPEADPIRFATAVGKDGLVGVSTVFHEPQVVWAAWSYRNFRKGAKWSVEWTRNGTMVQSRPDLTWTYGSTGTVGTKLQDDDGLAAGVYTVAIGYEGRTIVTGTMTVTGGATASGRRVTLTGSVTDRATGRPIAGAAVLVPRPGVRAADLRRDASSKTLLLYGTSDIRGRYVFPEGLPHGRKYSIRVEAEGYQPEVEEDGIDARKDGPLDVSVWLDRTE
jgi:hypothetical protein